MWGCVRWLTFPLVWLVVCAGFFCPVELRALLGPEPGEAPATVAALVPPLFPSCDGAGEAGEAAAGEAAPALGDGGGSQLLRSA